MIQMLFVKDPMNYAAITEEMLFLESSTVVMTKAIINYKIWEVVDWERAHLVSTAATIFVKSLVGKVTKRIALRGENFKLIS